MRTISVKDCDLLPLEQAHYKVIAKERIFGVLENSKVSQAAKELHLKEYTILLIEYEKEKNTFYKKYLESKRLPLENSWEINFFEKEVTFYD